MDTSPTENRDGTLAPPPPRGALRWPLAWKLLATTGALLLLIALGVAALTFTEVRSATTRELEQQGVSIAMTLSYAFEGLLDHDGLIDVQRVAANSATAGAVRRVTIVDVKGGVLASSDRMLLGQKLDFPWMKELQQSRRLEPIIEAGDERYLTIIQPLHSGKFDGASQYGLAGAVRVDLDRGAGQMAAYQTALRVLAMSFGGYAVFSGLLALGLRYLVVRPLHRLAGTAQRFREGQRALRSRIRSQDEIGQVSLAFDDMAEEVASSLGKLEEEVAARTEALDKLTRTLEELKASTDERVRLADTIRELSTPVIRVYHQILVMPLIGDIDTARAQQIQSSLLSGIERHSARSVIIDLTGVPVVDTQVADWLLKARRAAELLGAKVTFVGIAAKVAQSMVHLDVALGGMVTHGDLQSGLLHALHSQGLEIRRGARPAR